MKDASAYVVDCKANDLVAFKTIKSADEVDAEDFVHVALSKLVKQNKTIVVKIHEADTEFAVKEVKSMKTLAKYRNVVRYICSFECLDNFEKWIKPVKEDVRFCTGGPQKLCFIAMEYIPDGDLTEFLRNHSHDIKLVKSLLLQIAMVIVELGTIYKLCHGDINSGNILIAKTSKKNLTYQLFDEKYTLPTFGFIPIMLDFGHCREYEHRASNKKAILQDVLSAWSVFANWLPIYLEPIIRSFVGDELKTNKHLKDVKGAMDRLANLF